MPLAANSRLGPYEIKSVLGVGGMGEVYRARDSRLNRDVAIKVLRSDSTATPELKSRFEREARAVAALNHPNIVSVFDFGIDKVDGAEAQYIVSELIEGESLRHVIAGKPIPTRRLVDIAVQIADGLAAAHAAGIVHRDLKPENILVTKDGRAKILDFGLARQSAKTVPANSSDETYAPETKDHLTSAGSILGTASYMSPEQAVGKEIDYRSDQFSFGLILHEMATGKQAFARNSSVETMAAIVRDEPPPIEQKLPAPLKWIIDRCLNKEPEQRYESTRDLHRDLKSLRDHLSEAYSPSGVLAPVPAKVRPGRWEFLALSAAACLLLGSAVTYLLKPSGQNIAKYRYTPFASDASSAVWSPDGRAVAYSGKVNGVYQIFLRYLNSPLPVQLTSEKRNVWPLGWSSDRAHLIVSEGINGPDSSSARLYSVATVGGELEFIMDLDCHTCNLSRDGRALATLNQRSDGYFGIAISDPLGSPLKEYTPAPFASKELYESSQIDFSPDGKSILFCRQGERGVNELWRLPYPMGRGVPQRIQHNRLAFSGEALGSWMPDNRHVVFSFTTPESPHRHLAIADTRSEDFVQLTAGTSRESWPFASPDGKSILYTRDSSRGNVVSVSLQDGSTKVLVSTSSIEGDPGWAANQAKLAWSTDRSGRSEIWVRTPDGSERPAVRLADGPPGAEGLWNPSLSPDGGRVAYVAWTVQGNVQGLWLWISSLSGGSPVRLTNAEKEFEYAGSWSPDGSRLACIQTRNSNLSLMVVKTNGNAAPITLKQNVDHYLVDWSPDGNWITYHDKQGWNLISPDGKTSKPLGKIETPYLVFSRDGKLLYGIQTGDTELDQNRATLFSLDPATLKRRVIKELGTDFIPSSLIFPGVRFSLAPDGESFAYGTIKREHDLWMLQGYRQPGFWNQLTSAFSR